MLGAFAQAFRTPDLRRKLLFTLFIMAAFRLGSFIPTPGVDSQAVQKCMAQESQASLLDLVNLFSGGALLQLSIFALGIMPYITASIIIQLLRVVIPRFDDLHKEGQTGQAKLTQYTRYLTIFLGILQATTTISLARSGQLFQSCNQDVIKDRSILTFIMMIIVMMAGTGVIMWLGELITERGIGNGMSLLIFTSIAARLPEQLLSIGQAGKWGSVAAIVALLLLVAIAVVYVEQAQRRIPVQYAKRVVGRKMYGGQSSHIPLKVNMTGVMPIIFAQAIASLPATIAAFAGVSKNDPGFWGGFLRVFDTTSIFYIVVYFLLIVGFSFFYSTMQFNPVEVANNLKKNGGFIPGFRPGKPTADFIHKVLNKITMFGALYLAIIAIAPIVTGAVIGVSSLAIGGTSIIIVVGVALETTKALEAQMLMRHYKGFLE